MFLTTSVFFLAHEYSTFRWPRQTAIASEASKTMTTMDTQTLNIMTEEMLVETPSATKLVKIQQTDELHRQKIHHGPHLYGKIRRVSLNHGKSHR